MRQTATIVRIFPFLNILNRIELKLYKKLKDLDHYLQKYFKFIKKILLESNV